MRKFILCITLSIMLVLTMIPQFAFASQENSPAEGTSSEQNEESTVITGFAELESSEYYYEGSPEEEELTLNLPETLSVYLGESSTPADISVSWEAVEDFDSTDFYFFTMTPVWSDEYSLSPELSPIMDVPVITVYRLEDENSEMEPVFTEENIQPVYTEEEGPVDPETYEGDTLDAVSKAVKSAFAQEVYAASGNDNTALIYKYLTQTMGLNTAAACGVMTNIYYESGMSSINLQNCYNSSLGMSDETYTSRVDSGKYKKFTSDSAGYGLCQWTSSGRKSNLLSYAKAKNKSIGDATMQISFFSKEIQSSYQSVYTTLKNVPNNAAGAYVAAAEMCMAYEIPANTVSTAAYRGRQCLSTYWKKYSGSSASVEGSSFISLCGYSYPASVRNGKGMNVTGYAISNYAIKSITGKIIDSSGKTLYSKTLKPGTTSAKLSGMDSAMKFGSLSNGTYTYKVTAKDSLGKSVTATHKFSVKSSGSTSKAIGFASIGSSSGNSSSASESGNASAAETGKAYSGTYPKLPSRGYFKKGDKGTQVKNLQKLLNWCGCKVSTGGTYGSKTVTAVKQLQKKLGLKQDGMFGKSTLNAVKKYRK